MPSQAKPKAKAGRRIPKSTGGTRLRLCCPNKRKKTTDQQIAMAPFSVARYRLAVVDCGCCTTSLPLGRASAGDFSAAGRLGTLKPITALCHLQCSSTANHDAAPPPRAPI
uniref:Uncharacterized protein n=1 Tax=Bionectria ochroleuca TaxID=29856 RepID=A0A8H7NA66_BIOOC